MSSSPPTSLVSLARALGLSPTTVSRALRGTGRVSAATRARVLDAARKLNYVPNEHARRLLGAPSHVIGVLAHSAYGPAQPDYYMLEFIHALVASAASHGYSLELLPGDVPLAALRRTLTARAMDGVILITDDPRAGRSAASCLQSFPVVLISPARSPHLPPASVVIDRAAGSAAAAEHLLSLGHRSIALICGAESTGDTKRSAFLATCRRYGIPVPPARIVTAGTSIETAFRATTALVRQGVTAIFAETDWLALGCLHALHHAGLAVPRDCSLIGFDDLAFVADLNPPLTTVRVPRQTIAMAAVSMFRALVGGTPPLHPIDVPTELIRRASTAPPASSSPRATASTSSSPRPALPRP